MKTAILSIGDELVLGQQVDTNSAWLSRQTAHLGLPVGEQIVVPDKLDAIVSQLRRLSDTAELVIATGGLGPTRDDLTRRALADVMGVALRLDDGALRKLEAFFARRQVEMAPSNRVQAMFPPGCELIDNPTGTAAGMVASLGKALFFFLPGVPSEMKTMFAQSVAGQLTQLAQGRRQGQVVCWRRLHTMGMGESQIAEVLGDMMDRQRNPLVNSTVDSDIVTLAICAKAVDQEAAAALIGPVEQQLRSRLGRVIFACDDQTLAGAVGALLQSQEVTVATAESCTGGWLAKELTDVPGASAYFRAGWVSYSNRAKESFLRVDAADIGRCGAVSEEVAGQLAHNARQLAETDYGIATTGIAGPTGGSSDKPVGLVYVALAQEAGTVVRRHVFSGDRQAVRRRTVNRALDLLRLTLIEHQ